MNYLYVRTCLYSNTSDYTLITRDNSENVIKFVILNHDKLFRKTDDKNINHHDSCKLIEFLRPIYSKIIDVIPATADSLITTLEDNIFELNTLNDIIDDSEYMKLIIILDLAIKHNVTTYKKIEQFLTKTDLHYKYKFVKICNHYVQ